MVHGDRIRERRQALGLSQAAVGRAIGLDGQFISKFERGVLVNMATRTLEALADVLQCSTDYLLGRADDPTPPRRRFHVTEGAAPRS